MDGRGERLKMQGTRRRVKRVKEGMRITDYGLGVKVKELKPEGNGAGSPGCREAMRLGSWDVDPGLSELEDRRIRFIFLKCRNCLVAWHTEIHMRKLWQMPMRRFIYGLIRPKNLAILYLPQKGRG